MGGTNTGNGTTSAATVDLTAVGAADWTIWPAYGGKGSGNAQISDFVTLGALANVYNNGPPNLTWSDVKAICRGSSANGLC
jgi:hypothetical protein